MRFSRKRPRNIIIKLDNIIIKLEIRMTAATQADADALAAQLAAALPELQAKIGAGVDLTAAKVNADAITALAAPTAPTA